MVARATMAEIDAVRMSVDGAVALFRASVVPALEEQPGFEGAYVLVSKAGLALVLTFWSSEEEAEAGVESGFYDDQVRKFVTIYRAPPGRDVYDVVLAEAPAVTVG